MQNGCTSIIINSMSKCAISPHAITSLRASTSFVVLSPKIAHLDMLLQLIGNSIATTQSHHLEA